jgi:hypothetical protein
VKLLLDEHFSPRIAEALRARGDDVAAVAGSDLAGLADRQLVAAARDAGRVLVTENVTDFLAIAGELARVGAHHAGIVFTDPRRFPRSIGGVGRLVETLEGVVVAYPEENALADRVMWLVEMIDGR